MLQRLLLNLLVIGAFFASFSSGMAGGEDNKKQEDGDPLAKLTEGERKRLGQQLRDMMDSPKPTLNLTITAPKTVAVRPDKDNANAHAGVIEASVTVKNVGIQEFPYRPLLVDVAVCGENGEELSSHDWKWTKDFHGVSGTYPIETGKSKDRPAKIYLNGEGITPGNTYTIVACYIGFSECKFAVASVKAVAADEKGK
jgi:hypothetical protein